VSLSSPREGLIVVSRLQRVGPLKERGRWARGPSTFLAKQRNTPGHHFHYKPKLILVLRLITSQDLDEVKMLR
jgi:hypothetical protein